MDSTATKVCSHCHQEKPVTAFHRRKRMPDGRHGVCGTCRMAYEKHRLAHPLPAKQLPLPSGDEPTKRCRVCAVEKPLSQFVANWRFTDGHTHRCKSCDNAYMRLWWHEKLPKKAREALPDGFRRCTKCTEVKPLSAFAREQRAPDGANARCRACSSEDYRERTAFRESMPRPDITEKQCTACGEVRPRSDFHRMSATLDGLSQQCRACRSARKAAEFQEWYPAHRDVAHARAKAGRLTKRRMLAEYKHAMGCEYCGEDHPAALDFHHRDPSKKTGMVSRMAMKSLGLDRIIEEMRQCSVVCANCHRKLHSKNHVYLQPVEDVESA